MLTLHPYDPSSKYSEGPWAPLPDQLQTYLGGLDDYPQLRRLSECDPYDGELFSIDGCREMARELDRLALVVESHRVPDPPECVSQSPGEPADQPFGWTGLERFCRSLATVLQVGIGSGGGVVSLGD